MTSFARAVLESNNEGGRNLLKRSYATKQRILRKL